MSPSASYFLTPPVLLGALSRVLQSATFARAGYLRVFLQTCVEQTLLGNGGQLKEMWLGRVVFRRPSSFDPGSNPIVRVQAGRLREKLAKYYAKEGILDPVEIGFPVGSYIPAFMTRRGRTAGGGLAANRQIRIGVVPMGAAGSLPGNGQFAERLTAELRMALGMTANVLVSPQLTEWAQAKAKQDLRAVGRELEVEYLAQGSVELRPGTHHVFLQLIDIAAGEICWSASYSSRNQQTSPDAVHLTEMLLRELRAMPGEEDAAAAAGMPGIARAMTQSTSANPRFM